MTPNFPSMMMKEVEYSDRVKRLHQVGSVLSDGQKRYLENSVDFTKVLLLRTVQKKKFAKVYDGITQAEVVDRKSTEGALKSLEGNTEGN